MTYQAFDSLVIAQSHTFLGVDLAPIVLVIPWWVPAALVLAALVLAFFRTRASRGSWEPVSAEVNFADLGKVTIKPNTEDIQIAHRAWVELATRKAGLPFDPEHDVIDEVYDSWYELFGRLRELARDCPARKIRADEDTRQLVLTLGNVLNLGLRPHLTRWQARFRRWYRAAVEEASADRSPQEIQREYPYYHELVADLERVQQGLLRYMGLLKQLATGEE